MAQEQTPVTDQQIVDRITGDVSGETPETPQPGSSGQPEELPNLLAAPQPETTDDLPSREDLQKMYQSRVEETERLKGHRDDNVELRGKLEKLTPFEPLVDAIMNAFPGLSPEMALDRVYQTYANPQPQQPVVGNDGETIYPQPAPQPQPSPSQALGMGQAQGSKEPEWARNLREKMESSAEQATQVTQREQVTQAIGRTLQKYSLESDAAAPDHLLAMVTSGLSQSLDDAARRYVTQRSGQPPPAQQPLNPIPTAGTQPPGTPKDPAGVLPRAKTAAEAAANFERAHVVAEKALKGATLGDMPFGEE